MHYNTPSLCALHCHLLWMASQRIIPTHLIVQKSPMYPNKLYNRVRTPHRIEEPNALYRGVQHSLIQCTVKSNTSHCTVEPNESYCTVEPNASHWIVEPDPGQKPRHILLLIDVPPFHIKKLGGMEPNASHCIAEANKSYCTIEPNASHCTVEPNTL